MSTLVTTQADLRAALYRGDHDIEVDADPRQLLDLDVAVDPRLTRIRVTGWSRVKIRYNADVVADGHAVVDAADEVRVDAAGRAVVYADGRTAVNALQYATVYAGCTATVRLLGGATAWAWGQAVICGYGQATAHVTDSAACILHSPRATVHAGARLRLWASVIADDRTMGLDWGELAIVWPESGLIEAPAWADGGYGLKLGVSAEDARRIWRHDGPRLAVPCYADMDDVRISWPVDGERTPWIEARRATVGGGREEAHR